MKTKSDHEDQSSNDQLLSAQTVASVEDLLLSIFRRLPKKSIFRFKSVSKHWNSLINDPKFNLSKDLHPNPAIGQIILRHRGYCRKSTKYEYIPFSGIKSNNHPFRKSKFFNHPDLTVLLNSCNGLFLCHNSCTNDYDKKYYVYNPTTNQFSNIPKIYGLGLMFLAFDPALSPHYKVIFAHRFRVDGRDCHYQFKVYSSENEFVWKKCGEPFVERMSLENEVYWNRALHWLDFNGDSRDYNCLYFNIDDYALGVIPMPPNPEGYYRRAHLGESCGHLHYFVVTTRPKILLTIYEMKMDYSEWFVKYIIDLSRVVASNYPEMTRRGYSDPLDAFELFCLIEKEVDSFLVFYSPVKVIRYNIVDQTLETIYKFVDEKIDDFSKYRIAKGFQYIESFVSL